MMFECLFLFVGDYVWIVDLCMLCYVYELEVVIVCYWLLKVCFGMWLIVLLKVNLN